MGFLQLGSSTNLNKCLIAWANLYPGGYYGLWGINGLGHNVPGVTGQNIPPAGVYPGILWPRPIYIPGYILA